jgi:cobalt-zinc-cadmium efflux system outer membrane protein
MKRINKYSVYVWLAVWLLAQPALAEQDMQLHEEQGTRQTAVQTDAGGRRTDEIKRAAEPPAVPLTADLLVQEVLQRNQGIDAMRAAADAANARIEAADALDDPMVSYAVAPNTAGGPRQGLNQNLQISQKFPWPGTLDLRNKTAEAEAESAGRQVADMRLRLAAQTRADYAKWYYVHRALAINAENLILVSRLRDVAEAAYASGRSPQQDVLQAEVELTRLRNQALELERLRQTVRAKINALRNLDPRVEVPAPADLPPEIFLPEFVALRDTALAHYPMLQSFDARIAASRNRVDLAHKDNYPNINLIAGYNSLMDAPTKRLTVGVGINIPFGGNHRGEVNEAQARLLEAESKLADARIQLLSDLDQTYATATQDAKTIDLYTKHLLPLAKLNLNAAEADYSNGSGDFLKLITAEQQELMARLELARSRADFFTQFAALDYRTGGALTHTPTVNQNQDTMP